MPYPLIANLSLYQLFNYAECAVWLIVAAALPVLFWKGPIQKRGILARASLTFVAFGSSDSLEAPTDGQLPWWLWAWKILCVAYLLKCRYDYRGKERFRWFDRIHLIAIAFLLMVVWLIFLQFHSGESP